MYGLFGWKDLMKYPNEIYKLGAFVGILDTAEGLMPIKKAGNNSNTLIMWMADIRDAGLINRGEHMEIQQRMIHGPGGI